MVEGSVGLLLAVKHAKTAIQALLLEQMEFIGQVIKRIGTHGPILTPALRSRE